MRLGIMGHGFIEWGGGLDFLRLVCSSLRAADPALELHLLLPTKGPRLATRRVLRWGKRQVRRALGQPTLVAKVPGPSVVEEFIRSVPSGLMPHEIDLGSPAIARAASRLGLAGVLPSVQPLRLPPGLPWLGYIADYQHAHLPQYFSAEEVQARDRNFRAMLSAAPAVVVNARSVASDIQRFMPGLAARVVALPFSAAPHPAWFELGPPPLARYGIREPYFIISNQFWQHKDHLTAYRALARVREEHPQVQLVCTGETHDYRNPQHFPMLQEEARRLGLGSDALHVLGLIPKLEQVALLRGALAVVQPTLFEGGPGGGSVFDAVALGVPAIVSDIPVNLEISEPLVRFFRASDPQALAEAMLEHLERPQPTRPQPQALTEAGHRRRVACGHVLLEGLERQRKPA